MTPDSTKPALMQWQIPGRWPATPGPSGVLTHAPAGTAPGLPPEVALHLPTAAGNQVLLGALSPPGGHVSAMTCRDMAAGLFMADCFLHVERAAQILREAGIRWVCNLPTVGQHDRAFRHVLSEVEMGLEREFAVMAAFRARGFHLLVAVSGAEEAAGWARLAPEAIAHVPALAAYRHGPPGLSQRRRAEADLGTALTREGWQGAFLPYRRPAERSETEAEDGPCLCPPRPLTHGSPHTQPHT